MNGMFVSFPCVSRCLMWMIGPSLLHLQTCWKVFEGALVDLLMPLTCCWMTIRPLLGQSVGKDARCLPLMDSEFRTVAGCWERMSKISRKHTNGTQTKRLDAMQAMWSRLKLSASPYELKVRAIRTAAWPRGLHAIAATTIGLTTF